MITVAHPILPTNYKPIAIEHDGHHHTGQVRLAALDIQRAHHTRNAYLAHRSRSHVPDAMPEPARLPGTLYGTP